jgi:hypothetical protein
MQPLRLAAEAKTGFVHVFDRRRRHMIAQAGREALKPGRAVTTHGGNGGGDKRHAEQIGHQSGQTLFRQQLIMQQIHHHRRKARAVLHRRCYIFRESSPRLGPAMTADAVECTVFGDNQRLRFGKVEHLAHGMADDRRTGQGTAASATVAREMIDGGVGIFRAAQGFAGMALLTARLLARLFAQAAGPGRLLLQAVA